MRQSKLLIPTLREGSNEQEAVGYQMLVRAGYIRQAYSGVYYYLPLAYKVLEKINNIIREELTSIDAAEVLLPDILPIEFNEEDPIYENSEDLITCRDRNDREFVLSPTHEMILTDLIKSEIKSYKRLPLFLYQIQSKYRDEKRPRLGLLRSKEFIMQDSYSFHESEESLSAGYQLFEKSYQNILQKCGLDFKIIIGKSDSVKKRESKEYMAISDIGEETICYSSESDYASNLEIATSQYMSKKSHEIQKELEKLETSGVESIKDLCEMLEIEPAKIIKTLFYMAEEQPIMIAVRGDHTLNLTKLKNHLKTARIFPATEKDAIEILGATFGSLGPVHLPENIKLYADYHVADMANTVAGANETGFHYLNVNPSRDFTEVEYADFRMVKEDDISPDGEGVLKFEKAIKVAQIVKSGSIHSDAMNTTVLDQNGEQASVLLGRYAIGISRLLAAIAEQNADENGLNWPQSISPFDLHLVPIQYDDEIQKELTKELELSLTQKGYNVLIDDRNERAGVKFADADLIGIPFRITIGKKASEGVIEVKIRKTGEMIEVRKEDLDDTITILLDQDD